jgi:hypothetical protein
MKKIASILFVLASAVTAQNNGSVTGVVTDSSGAVAPGAQVVLVQTETAIVSRAVTNADGVYRFASVAVGTYELTVTATGFKEYVLNGVVVETAQTVRADAALQLGDAQESVTVTDRGRRIGSRNFERRYSSNS